MERDAWERPVIGVDTNVLLRILVRDEPEQTRNALEFIENRTSDDPAFVSLIVVAELVWALRQRYDYPMKDIRRLLSAMLEAREFIFEEEALLVDLFNSAESGRGDVADHLIAYSATRAGCTHTVTFDQRAAKAIPSMELLA
ncbi:type II toxin-antitoxin system VapC family toxin [Mesorhizobium sp. DCY119]|uniref:PIN domain-containing protein n=1 Tax=Mesorhizobium sp. DCY119 TaxID=2108445 RepID=UPI000E6B8AF6|nr:type II toxin-antitoxin system VapC family toxin [Mesorhizobium sp. DCY119]RJG43700.1 PIN domain-containing protein [Mesorhizobium sp. DCY119]